MHVGKVFPYERSLRVYMGQYGYPNWVRELYEAIPAVVLPWAGPDSGQITNAGPYTIARDPTLETGLDHFVFSGFVQTITTGDVYVGFECRLNSDGTEIRAANQTWLGTVPQIDNTGNDWNVFSWGGFVSGTLFYPLVPGGRVRCRITTYNAVPY